MPRKANFLSCILCVVGAISCASAAPQTGDVDTDEATARIVNSEVVLPNQIDDQVSSTATFSLTVDQIDQSSTNADYAFKDVEGDDPCLDPETSRTARCQTGRLNGSSFGTNQKRSSDTALKELQSIVPNVVDPNSFDAERTADEIGRSGGALQSQVGMALGAQFLNPLPELEDDNELDNDRPDGTSSLSPDFIPPPRAVSQ